MYVHVAFDDDFVGASDDLAVVEGANFDRPGFDVLGVDGVANVDIAHRAESTAELNGLRHPCDEWWESVLVPVVEGVENIEQFAIASHVCLKPLDRCVHTGRHVVLGRNVIGDSALEMGLGSDRPHGGGRVARRVLPSDLDSELVGEMVEPLPHVVSGVADQ